MIFPVLKKHLLLIDAIIWGLPGVMILLKGVRAYVALQSAAWWMYLVSFVVFVLFALMFSKIVKKYSDRIAGLAGARRSAFDAFSIKGYVLIASMMLLGIVLKFIPGIPAAFFATFYCGLGPALLLALLIRLSLLLTVLLVSISILLPRSRVSLLRPLRFLIA